MLHTSRLWRRVAERVAGEYPDVTMRHLLVDACAMELLRQPATFDVIVTENTFGDILTDEASMLVGSLGMLPSASLGARRTAHGNFGLYEPIHGTAPDITGQGIANPLASILSVALLLRYSLGLANEADAVELAVIAAIDAGYRTADIARMASSRSAPAPWAMLSLRNSIHERSRTRWHAVKAEVLHSFLRGCIPLTDERLEIILRFFMSQKFARGGFADYL